MMNSKSLLIIEIIWITTGILCIIAGIRFAIANGFNNRLFVFALMAGTAFLFAWLRHKQRKKN